MSRNNLYFQLVYKNVKSHGNNFCLHFKQNVHSFARQFNFQEILQTTFRHMQHCLQQQTIKATHISISREQLFLHDPPIPRVALKLIKRERQISLSLSWKDLQGLLYEKNKLQNRSYSMSPFLVRRKKKKKTHNNPGKKCHAYPVTISKLLAFFLRPISLLLSSHFPPLLYLFPVSICSDVAFPFNNLFKYPLIHPAIQEGTCTES